MSTSRKGKRVALLLAAVVIVGLPTVAWLAWPDIQFHWRFESLGKNVQGLPEYRHRQTGIVMVHLSGGEFLMGSPTDLEDVGKEECPQHEVTLSPFLVGKYEVTRAQWHRVMAKGSEASITEKAAHLPAGDVSWYDCQEFCQQTGLQLPTEAQWEYACRAGTTGAYGGTERLSDMGWHKMSQPRGPQPGGQKSPNGFGLYDMHGNLWEWCLDIYEKDFYKRPAASKKDPVCTSGPDRRVRRGGCWSSPVWNCRSAYRRDSDPDKGTSLRGFRVSAACP